MVADGELQRIMAQVDLDGNNTLDFQASGEFAVDQIWSWVA